MNADIEGPYILVGWSRGGFHIRVFASLYPEEVVGMALVESAHPDQWARWLAALPPKSSDEPRILANFRDSCNRPEIGYISAADLATSMEQVRAAGSLGDLPLAVVTRSPDKPMVTLPREASADVEQVWQELQVEMAGLSSNSIHLISERSGHGIISGDRELVIEGIFWVLEQATE